MKEENKLAQEVLLKEYFKLGGEIFADFFLRLNAVGDAKKSIEANDFLIAIMSGKNIKQEWKLENSETYQKFQQLVKVINSLS